MIEKSLRWKAATQSVSEIQPIHTVRLTSILQLDAEQQEMGKLSDVNRTDSILAKEVGPIVLEVLVEDPIANVEGQKILDLDGSSKSK